MVNVLCLSANAKQKFLHTLSPVDQKFKFVRNFNTGVHLAFHRGIMFRDYTVTQQITNGLNGIVCFPCK